MKNELYYKSNKNIRGIKDLLSLDSLDLPKILPRTRKITQIPKVDPELKKRYEKYNFKNFFRLPKLENNSPRYHQILKTEDLKELAKNNLKNNRNIFSYLDDKHGVLKKKIVEKLNVNEPNDKYGNSIKNLIRLHSSKYHPEKEIKKSSLDEFDIMLNKLKYGNYDLYSDDREIKYRQRLAFKYRFLQKEKNIIPINIQKMNSKMNNILNISKSIPNYALKNTTELSKPKLDEANKKKEEPTNNSVNSGSLYGHSDRLKKIYKYSDKRKMKSYDNIEITNRSNIISYDKNGKKFISHLSLLL